MKRYPLPMLELELGVSLFPSIVGNDRAGDPGDNPMPITATILN